LRLRGQLLVGRRGPAWLEAAARYLLQHQSESGQPSSVPADALRLGHGKKMNGEENDDRKKLAEYQRVKLQADGLLLPLLLVSLEDYLSPEQ